MPGPDGVNPCSLALANMTGANRVLVGVGWPLIVLVAALTVRRARRAAERDRTPGSDDERDRRLAGPVGHVALQRPMSVEVVFLGLVTLYSLSLPLRSSLTMIDGGVLLAIFAGYLYRLSQAAPGEPELSGVSDFVGQKSAAPRRTGVAAMFGVAAVVILACAEHFAESLVNTGHQLGVDTFVLVQWVAPLASEAPELIVAGLYAGRLKSGDALGALLSSKVNQWSLLVGTIPVGFAVSAWTTNGLPLDGHQRVELLLTAAQSLFAVSILVNLRLPARGAAALFVLFTGQFVASITVPGQLAQTVSLALAGLYVVLALGQMLRRRSDAVRLLRDGLRTPFADLERTG